MVRDDKADEEFNKQALTLLPFAIFGVIMKVDGIYSATILSRYRPRSLGSLAVSEAETGGKAMLSERLEFLF